MILNNIAPGEPFLNLTEVLCHVTLILLAVMLASFALSTLCKKKLQETLVVIGILAGAGLIAVLIALLVVI